MADLQQQLQAILSDPEAMGQISALAGALTGTQPDQAEGPDQASRDSSPPPEDLFSALGGEGAGGPDPALLRTAAALLGEYNAPADEKTALLEALKPFLDQQRRQKLDQAERAARMVRVLRSALRLWREDPPHV